MNGFYWAKKKLKLAGLLDLYGSCFWAILTFLIAAYHFCYLIPGNSPYSSLTSSSSSISVTSTYSSSFISSKGYLSFFNLTLINFALFRITLGHVVSVLFFLALFCFIGKLVFGCPALFYFCKAKNIRFIYAAVAVIFFPIFGGVVAINTYEAYTSKLSPKYIASNSFIRQKCRSVLNSLLNENVSK